MPLHVEKIPFLPTQYHHNMSSTCFQVDFETFRVFIFGPNFRYRCLEEGAEEFFLKPVRLSDVNKLRPHLMRTKCCKNIQNQENQENKESPEIQLHTAAQSNNSNKRKAIDEGISPDRTRPRYSDLTLVSN